MIPPKIATLPPAPVRSDAPVDFSTKADAMVGALQPFANEANILAEFVNTRAINANASATSVAGVQSTVSADRVLSQQAASNAAGSAAAALLSANNASGSAGAAQLSANASEASAVRAENAAEYVEGISGGAAPINNPNFQGVVKVNDVPLGYAATAPTVGDGVDVMRTGAFGLGYAKIAEDFSERIDSGFYLSARGSVGMPPGMALDGGWMINLNWRYDNVGNRYNCAFYGSVQNNFIGFRRINNLGEPQASVELHHTGNLLNIGTTSATARTALNIFADASGVMTNGPGQLSNDMSDFLGSATFDEMSSKVGGGGEIDFTTLANNAAALTPVAGKAYWLTRTATTALTTTLTCTHAPGKIRTWHVIVSKGTGANDTFIPAFRVSGLTETSVRWSGGGTVKPSISGVSHVMIMFMQIDQSVRATIVDGW